MSKSTHRIATISASLLVTAAVVLLLLWLVGAFHEKIPAKEAGAQVLHKAAGAATLVVEERRVRVHESAVGTIRPVTETKVGAQILATVRVMHAIRSGQAFKKGDVLVELDDTDLEARLQQARAALEAAQANLAKARTDLARTKRLFAEKVASKEKLDRDQTRVTAGKAQVQGLKQAVASAQTILRYATIRAPIDGIIVDKQVNQGDLVSPGQTVVTMYNPGRLQLIAIVRERLAAKLRVGKSVNVHIEALGKSCAGRVDQIVPEASGTSRSFQVKVTGPCSPDVLSGMFGRLTVAVGERLETRIPRSAVRSIGQLDFVFVVSTDDTLLRRFVRTGDSDASTTEILSGLTAGERILADASSVR